MAITLGDAEIGHKELDEDADILYVYAKLENDVGVVAVERHGSNVVGYGAGDTIAEAIVDAKEGMRGLVRPNRFN